MIDPVTVLTFVILFISFVIVIILCLISNKLKKLNGTMEKFLNQYIANHPDEK